ncbi:MAG: ester cyclase, partial [Pseudomonadota bacterium]|nr:ester cyclase [Pseudomonadota bacterium]
PEAVMQDFVAPLQAAFPDLERRTDIYIGGHWQSPPAGATGYSPPEVAGPGWWVSTTGHYVGTFMRNWLGIAATGEPATLRFGEFYRWQRGVDGSARVVEARILLDIVDLARQAGLRLLPLSLGREWSVPGPAGHDGLLLDATDPAYGTASMAQVLAMVAGLFSFDGRNLQTMGMERFWHPQMMWYGPCGIGSTRGIGGFQRHHQAPFLHAFPDRKGAGHRARIAEGAFVASTGWPSVRATHAGAYLGVAATGRPIGMRVMDWWRCEGPWLKENWVLIDLPHLLLQMDVDVLAPLR